MTSDNTATSDLYYTIRSRKKVKKTWVIKKVEIIKPVISQKLLKQAGEEENTTPRETILSGGSKKFLERCSG